MLPVAAGAVLGVALALMVDSPEREVQTSHIGQLLMERLRQVDKDGNEFLNELNRLMHKPPAHK